ncbi:suppressor of fused domain protein [Actinoplanes sp. NPDC051851]|uniref:suppressor of fused domain protein n=1 Tax=Actinoplanes sp. NPDC051851 TaxID=3154753 RepID=UPI00343C1CE7
MLADHLRGVFPDQKITQFDDIVRVELRDRDHLYATTGPLVDGHNVGFVLQGTPGDEAVHRETLTMVAFYHASGGSFALDHGHTVPIGRPWVLGSRCDHLLVSLPYPWGPTLETADFPGGHLRLLWLLPITKAEKSFRHEHGLEALEQRFDEAELLYADPYRKCVVAG